MSIVYTTTDGTLNTGSLHHFILKHIILEGYAPKRAKICEHFDESIHEVDQAMYELQDQHGVVLHPHEPEVWVIHPFATAPTNFVVSTDFGTWWSPCAWCALGVVALAADHQREGYAQIRTNIGAEFKEVTIDFEYSMLDPVDLLIHFPIPMKKAWDNVIYTCSNMQIFENEEQIDRWCLQHQIPKGDVQPLKKIWEFAQDWYGNHLDPRWEKWTVEEAKAIIEKHGLTHPIWDLGDSKERF